jgi:hypothetical protein
MKAYDIFLFSFMFSVSVGMLDLALPDVGAATGYSYSNTYDISEYESKELFASGTNPTSLVAYAQDLVTASAIVGDTIGRMIFIGNSLEGFGVPAEIAQPIGAVMLLMNIMFFAQFVRGMKFGSG